MTRDRETRGGHETAASARQLVAARQRAAGGDRDHTVHLVALPGGGDDRLASALCGAWMDPVRMHILPSGEEPSCALCVVVHATADTPPLPDTAIGSATVAQQREAVAQYRSLGWPLRLRPATVALDLDPLDAAAVVIPTGLATDTTRMLTRRRCPPTVLAHPALPGHQILLASERSQVPLSWPAEVHRFTGALALPPTRTTYGPVRWVHPPQPTGLRLCRAFDVAAALIALTSGANGQGTMVRKSPPGMIRRTAQIPGYPDGERGWSV